MPIQESMMRGGTRIRKIIADHLSLHVPPSIDIMRDQYNLSAQQLPYPAKYDSTDPVESDTYPYMGAFVTGADRFRRIDTLETGATEYDAIYETTVFVTTKTAQLGLDRSGMPKWEEPNRDSAIRMRDDLMAVLSNVILNWPSLGTAGSRYRVQVDDNSFRHSYPEPMKGNTVPVWICSGILTVNIRLNETTVVPYIGNVETISDTIELIS